jgi:hypothetical protein
VMVCERWPNKASSTTMEFLAYGVDSRWSRDSSAMPEADTISRRGGGIGAHDRKGDNDDP